MKDDITALIDKNMLAKLMAKESLALLTDKYGELDPLATGVFLSEVIQAFLTKILNEAANQSDSAEEAYNMTADAFVKAKNIVEVQVAFAFYKAVHKFSGHPVDYYCQVKVVPEPLNKVEC